MKKSEAFRLVINCQKKHTVQNPQCFCVNEVIGIRDGKELLQSLPSPTTTGYCLPAEDNIKLIYVQLAIRRKKRENIFKQEAYSKIFLKSQEFYNDLLLRLLKIFKSMKLCHGGH